MSLHPKSVIQIGQTGSISCSTNNNGVEELNEKVKITIIIMVIIPKKVPPPPPFTFYTHVISTHPSSTLSLHFIRFTQVCHLLIYQSWAMSLGNISIKKALTYSSMTRQPLVECSNTNHSTVMITCTYIAALFYLCT